MGSRRQLPDQLQYSCCICFFNNAVINKGFFRCIKFKAGKAATLLYMIYCFIDNYSFQPPMKISFGCIVGVYAPEHLYKSRSQYIARFLFTGSITHSNRHSKAIKLPVQLFLCFSLAVTAINYNIV